eukprot:7196-Amphidinium_carterae.1
MQPRINGEPEFAYESKLFRKRAKRSQNLQLARDVATPPLIVVVFCLLLYYVRCGAGLEEIISSSLEPKR